MNDGGLRSNKFPEGHNHALQLTAGCSHPGIKLLVEIPTLYNTDADLDIQQTLSGTVLVPPSKEKISQFRSKISLNVTITIVGSCALYALYALKNQKRTFNSRDQV